MSQQKNGELILSHAELAETTAGIVAAYVSNNQVPAASLPELIANVHESLLGLTKRAVVEQPAPTPAANPKKSVFPDYIISLEDGKKLKSLKRHLSARGMSPTQYRAKWKLPVDYPMVAPNYATARSAIARAAGLGRKVAAQAPVKRQRKAARP